MVRKWALVLFTVLLALTLLVSPALATHKPGHDYPPGCFNEPPPQAQDHKCWKHGFSSPPESQTSLERLERTAFNTIGQEDPGITVWMISLVALGAFAVVLTADHRRRAQALRRRLRA